MKYLILVFILFTYGSTDPIIASYGIQPELYWLEEFYYTGDPIEPSKYSAIYYEPLSNQYYFATIEKTNNISYDTSNIKDEQNYINYKMSSLKMPITYISSIDLTNRIYIDSNNNQYLKKLSLISDTHYYDYEEQLQKSEYPVYPMASHYGGSGGDIYEGVFYTNTRFIFVRSLAQEPSPPYSPYSKGVLSTSPYGN